MPTHRVLSAIAHNLAHSFMSGLNFAPPPFHSVDGELLNSCFHAKVWSVRLDFLASAVEPPSLRTPSLERAVRLYRDFLANQLIVHGFSGSSLQEAVVTVYYDPTLLLPCTGAHECLQAPFVATGTLTDIVGRVHTGTVYGASVFPTPHYPLAFFGRLWRRLTRRAT